MKVVIDGKTYEGDVEENKSGANAQGFSDPPKRRHQGRIVGSTTKFHDSTEQRMGTMRGMMDQMMQHMEMMESMPSNIV